VPWWFNPFKDKKNPNPPFERIGIMDLPIIVSALALYLSLKGTRRGQFGTQIPPVIVHQLLF
jgi:hypothetical protein